jgi:hypothetical protein
MNLPLVSSFSKISWFPFSDEPVLRCLWYLGRLCDPCILLPDQGPDGKWHLFAHTWVGLEHFTSENGISWEPRKMIELRGHSPFVFYQEGVWYLVYEKHDSSLPALKKGRMRRRDFEKVSSSRFEIRSSSDLILYSEPKIILDSKDVPFSGLSTGKPRISRPQLFKTEEGYSLYFGASHTVLEDSGQKATKYFALATSTNLEGPYILANEGQPLLKPDANDKYRNMACGSIKVVQALDGFAAFECAMRWDKKEGKTSSILLQLESSDGIAWKSSFRAEILPTPEKGWADRYVVSCDAKYKADEQCWYCYYSANSKKGIFPVRESIGLLLGKDPSLRKVFV